MKLLPLVKFLELEILKQEWTGWQVALPKDCMSLFSLAVYECSVHLCSKGSCWKS